MKEKNCKKKFKEFIDVSMSKMNIGTNVFMQGMPVTLLGTKTEGKANFMALAWLTRVNGNPPLMGVGVNKSHLTNKLIRENKSFSINIPSDDMIIETDYCGLVSGKNKDKSGVFKIFYAELNEAPMIKECPLAIECKLYSTVELPTHDIFIGEIIGTYTEEKYLSNDKLDINKINPFLLTMPDNHYWKIGENIGKAWNVGKKYQ